MGFDCFAIAHREKVFSVYELFSELYGKDFVAEAEQLLSHVDEDIQNYGIGLISEFYDGNPPYVGHGCISQARNTAEIIRSIYLIQCYREGKTKKM